MLLFITEKANNIEEKRKKQRGNIVKGQRNGQRKQLQYFWTTRSENTKKEVKTAIHDTETAEVTERKCSECWQNYVQTAKEDDKIEHVRCRKRLHHFFSPHKDQLRQKVIATEKQQDAEEDLENVFLCNLDH